MKAQWLYPFLVAWSFKSKQWSQDWQLANLTEFQKLTKQQEMKKENAVCCCPLKTPVSHARDSQAFHQQRHQWNCVVIWIHLSDPSPNFTYSNIAHNAEFPLTFISNSLTQLCLGISAWNWAFPFSTNLLYLKHSLCRVRHFTSWNGRIKLCRYNCECVGISPC